MTRSELRNFTRKLAKFYHETRGVGHTETWMEEVDRNPSKKYYVLVDNAFEFSRDMNFPNVKFLDSTSILNMNFKNSERRPIIIDNSFMIVYLKKIYRLMTCDLIQSVIKDCDLVQSLSQEE